MGRSSPQLYVICQRDTFSPFIINNYNVAKFRKHNIRNKGMGEKSHEVKEKRNSILFSSGEWFGFTRKEELRIHQPMNTGKRMADGYVSSWNPFSKLAPVGH